MQSRELAIVIAEAAIVIVLVISLLSFYTIPTAKTITPTAATLAPGDIMIQQITAPRASKLSYSVTVKGGAVNVAVYDSHGAVLYNRTLTNSTTISLALGSPGDYRIVFTVSQGYATLAVAGSLSYKAPLGETPYSIVAGLLFIPLGITVGIILAKQNNREISSLRDKA